MVTRSKTEIVSLFFVAVLCLFLSGCTFGKVRHRAIHIPEHALDQSLRSIQEEQIAVDAEWLSDEWWTLFDDSQLIWCIETALDNNPSMEIACAKVRQAQAWAQQKGAPLYPFLGWKTKFDHFKLSRSELSPEGITGPLSYNNLETLLTFSYEVDLWGKNRSAWQEALGLMWADWAEVSMSRLMLSITVAKTYFSLQTSFARERIMHNLLENREENLRLVEEMVEQNVADAYLLENAFREVEQARTMLFLIQQDQVAYQTSLWALLASGFCQSFLPVSIVPAAEVKIPLPSTLPCDLLARRPEIFAQKWRIESALKGVDVAKAEFYPNLDLFSIIGFKTIHISKIFRGGSYSGDYGSAFHLPIFDGYKRVGNLRYQKEEVVLRIEEYNQMVLDAVQQTIEGVQQLQLAKDLWKAREAIQKTTEGEYRLTKQRFEQNVDSLFNLLMREENSLLSQDQLILAQETTLLTLLTLIKATGGGYDSQCR